jgi:hypothetical protein
LKEVSIKIAHELTVVPRDDDGILAARTRMADLFRATANFGVGVRSSREDTLNAEAFVDRNSQ